MPSAEAARSLPDDVAGSVFPSIPLGTVLLVVVLGLFGTHLQAIFSNRRSASAKPPRFASVDDKKILIALGHLANLTYFQSRILDTPSGSSAIEPVIPNGEDMGKVHIDRDGTIRISVAGQYEDLHSSYRIVQVYNNNSIWLFRPVSKAIVSAEWIIAFRGTLTVPDLFTDFKLAAAVAGACDTPLLEYLDTLFQNLLSKIFRNWRISKSDSIVLVGHSLGATLADAMLSYLHKDGYTSVSAFCFDSPGLPDVFRESFDYFPNPLSSKLTLVYGHENFFNQLASSPLGAKAFRVGKDDPMVLSKMGSLFSAIVRGYLSGTPRKLFCSMVGYTLEAHNLQNIIKLLEEGWVQEDLSASQKRLFGAAAPGYLFSCA